MTTDIDTHVITLEEYRATARNMSIVSLEDLYEIAVHADTPPSFKLKFHEMLMKSADFEPKMKELSNNGGNGFQLIINMGNDQTISIGAEQPHNANTIEGIATQCHTTPLTMSIASLCESVVYETACAGAAE